MKKIEFFLNDYRIRLSSYISIWLIYLYFMLNNSLRGIDWLPFQEERVRNSVNHIINNSSFIKFGVTSWLPLNYTPEFKNTITYFGLIFSQNLVHLPNLVRGGQKLWI